MLDLLRLVRAGEFLISSMETILRSQSLGERWSTRSFSQKSVFQFLPHVFSILMSGELDLVRSTLKSSPQYSLHRTRDIYGSILFLIAAVSSSRAVPSIERYAAPIECNLLGHFVFENNRTDRPKTKTSAVPAPDSKVHSCLEKTSEPNS